MHTLGHAEAGKSFHFGSVVLEFIQLFSAFLELLNQFDFNKLVPLDDFNLSYHLLPELHQNFLELVNLIFLDFWNLKLLAAVEINDFLITEKQIVWCRKLHGRVIKVIGVFSETPRICMASVLARNLQMVARVPQLEPVGIILLTGILKTHHILYYQIIRI